MTVVRPKRITPMADWNPNLYLRFADERTQPARDLAARVVLSTEQPRIIDLGCGPGNSTAVLRVRWPQAREITGLDSSPAMIETARKAQPEGRWEVGDASAWTDPTGEGYDLVFSNAVFHWVPNHAELFPRLLALVKPGGALAVQMPAKAYPALHKLIVETADAEPAWREATQKSRGVIRVLEPGAYYDLLSPQAARVEIWETRYHHVMDQAGAVIDWLRSTGLRPWLDALPSDEDRARFEEKLRAGAGVIYPAQADGKVRFPFGRIFLVAYRA